MAKGPLDCLSQLCFNGGAHGQISLLGCVIPYGKEKGMRKYRRPTIRRVARITTD